MEYPMLKIRHVAAVALLCCLGLSVVNAAERAALVTVPVKSSGSATTAGASFDGVVEALRQTAVSAQVAGVIVALNVKAGDVVKAGQVLLRIDARAAGEGAAASVAQVEAARATLNVASKEFERQQQLFQKQYISQAALERAQAQLEASQAQVRALQAQAGVAKTQTGFFVVAAPYAGVVSEVPVALGDMAMPGRPLFTLYDPAALRVSAFLPQSALAGLGANPDLRLEIPGMATPNGLVKPTSVQMLPTVDSTTHTAQVRLGLLAGVKGLAPGMFARVWLPTAAATGQSTKLFVPTSAVLHRAEMTGIYVLDSQGQPLLRQVRLGQIQGADVEVLSGVQLGEKVAVDPQAAAKAR
jgi:RND family efflux transporter MFP subunit